MALMTKVRAQLGIPGKNDKPAEPAQAAPGTSPTTDEGDLAVADAEVTDGAADEGVDDEPKKNWWQRRAAMKKLTGTFDHYPHLLALKPKEKYVFRSDYFQVDESVGCIMAFFHDDAAMDGFSAFWGIDRIPDGLDDRVTAVLLEQVVRKDDKWVDQFTKQSEKLDKLDAREQDETGTTSTRRKAAKVSADLEDTIAEIQNGASYLNVHNRLFLKAPDLETLEESIDRVMRLYIDRFGTVKIAAYAGEQRKELSNLWARNEDKKGKGFGFTSTELAGSYSLVTNGLNDRDGEYVGYMVGDVNNSAVIMNVNRYDRRVVIADEAMSPHLHRTHISNMWCSKISQAALLNNARVVHLVLDGADLDGLGPKFDALTSRVDLNSGDVNMFEMFGEPDDELAVFASQMQKLVLMFEQVYEATDSDRSIIRGELEKTATQFYVDQRMWHRNAKSQRQRLRVVGIPHEQVPRLQMFVSYLDQEHKALLNSTARDDEALHAYGVLRVVAKNMLDNNGDLFNNHTATTVDGIRDARRVIYDFSALRRRGKGVAMAQLVNIMGFAVGRLERGDSVIIHGAEYIDDRVKDYIEQQLEQLYQRGGRVVFSYNGVDKMLKDSDFNKFGAADYTVFGPMLDKTVLEYQEQLAQKIPPDLAQLISTRGENLSYLRRGITNVVFHLDLALGINPYREAQRRKLHQEATKAAEAQWLDALMNGDVVPGAQTTSVKQSEDALVDDDSTGRAAARKARRKKNLPQDKALENPGAPGSKGRGKHQNKALNGAEPRKLARR